MLDKGKFIFVVVHPPRQL
jgi:hypothetical protein